MHLSVLRNEQASSLLCPIGRERLRVRWNSIAHILDVLLVRPLHQIRVLRSSSLLRASGSVTWKILDIVGLGCVIHRRWTAAARSRTSSGFERKNVFRLIECTLKKTFSEKLHDVCQRAGQQTYQWFVASGMQMFDAIKLVVLSTTIDATSSDRPR